MSRNRNTHERFCLQITWVVARARDFGRPKKGTSLSVTSLPQLGTAHCCLYGLNRARQRSGRWCRLHRVREADRRVYGFNRGRETDRRLYGFNRVRETDGRWYGFNRVREREGRGATSVQDVKTLETPCSMLNSWQEVKVQNMAQFVEQLCGG